MKERVVLLFFFSVLGQTLYFLRVRETLIFGGQWQGTMRVTAMVTL